MKKNFQNIPKKTLYFIKKFIRNIVPFIKRWSKLQTWKDTFFLPENPQENARLIRFLGFTFASVLIFIGIVFIITFNVIRMQAANVRVPNIEKLPLIEAVQILNNSDLTYHLEFSFNTNAHKYEIISQHPHRGTSVKKGRSVFILVSMGRDEYTVPELQGKSKEEGMKILEEQQIPYRVQTVPTEGQAINTILAMDKEPGVVVARDEILILTVTDSLEEGQYRVDNFVNQPLEFAVNTLYGKKITPVIISTPVTELNQDGIILSQDIEPNTILQEGTKVTITAGLYANDESERENLKWHSLYYYIPYASAEITESGQRTGRDYKAVLENQLGRRRTIYERVGAEGSSFVRVFKSFGKSTVYIYADDDIIATKNYQ